jgi:hypothetical protein
MYAEPFDDEDLDLDLYHPSSSSEEDDSDLDGSSDLWSRDLGEWRQDIRGVYRPADELDDEVEEQVQGRSQHLPPLPPAFQVDPVHLDILELPGRLRSRQAAAERLLSDEDKEGLWEEDGSMASDHPLIERALSGDASALIQPPEYQRLGAELRAVINMLGTASLWLRSVDPSSIPPEAQELIVAHTFGLLSSVQLFPPPPNEAGTFNVPPPPPVASGSASTSSAGPSSGTMGEPSSSSKRRRRRHRH